MFASFSNQTAGARNGHGAADAKHPTEDTASHVERTLSSSTAVAQTSSRNIFVPAAIWKAYLQLRGTRREFADNLLSRAIKTVWEQATLEGSLQSLTADLNRSRQPDSGSAPLLYDSIIRGLSTVPGYLRIHEEIGLARTLEAGAKLTKFPCRTLFRPKREGEANSACYLPALDLCVVDSKRPTGQELVKSLLETGGLGPCFDAMTHEFTHVMQIGIGYRRAIRAIVLGLVAAPFAVAIVSGVAASLVCCGALALGATALGAAIGRSAKVACWSEFRDRAPFEVHAYYVERTNPAGTASTFHPADIRKHVLDRVVSGTYLEQDHFVRAQRAIERIFDLIDGMVLLGMGHREVAAVLRGSDHAGDSDEFPHLEEALRRLCEKQGLSRQEDYQAAREALGELRNTEQINLRSRARLMALTASKLVQ